MFGSGKYQEGWTVKENASLVFRLQFSTKKCVRKSNIFKIRKRLIYLTLFKLNIEEKKKMKMSRKGIQISIFFSS